MAVPTHRLANEIAAYIRAGELDSSSLFLIETACRSERMKIGPYRVGDAEVRGRKAKALRKKTSDELSFDLKAATIPGAAAFETISADPAPPKNSATPEELARLREKLTGTPAQTALVAYDYQRLTSDIKYGSKFYGKQDLIALMVDKNFTYRGALYTVVKFNRTRAQAARATTGRLYTFPITTLIKVYLNGDFT